MESIQPGKYMHYKEKPYLVIGECRHSETLEVMVLYISLYDNPTSQVWVRPKSMFLEEVEWEGKMVPRYRYLGPQLGEPKEA